MTIYAGVGGLLSRSRYNDGQLELFTVGAGMSDIRAKNVRSFMSHGLFRIGNNQVRQIEHTSGEDFIRVSAREGVQSIATYHDNDVLIFLTSHLVEAMNKGEKTSNRIFFTANEFFKFAGRDNASGDRYGKIWNTLSRLQGTMVHTNLGLVDGQTVESRFSWLNEVHRVKSKSGVSVGFEAHLSMVLYQAIVAQANVLTLDRRYFDFRSGFQKWLYLYARKSAGNDGREWIASEEHLHKRSGSAMDLKDFRKLLRRATSAGSLADYNLKSALVGRNNAIVFERDKLALNKTYKTVLVNN